MQRVDTENKATCEEVISFFFFFSFTQTWKHTHTHTHLEMTESFVIDVNRYNTHSRGKEKKDESEHTQRAD